MKKVAAFIVVVMFLAGSVLAGDFDSNKLSTKLSIYGNYTVTYNGETARVVRTGNSTVKIDGAKIKFGHYTRPITEGAVLRVDGYAFRTVWTNKYGWVFQKHQPVSQRRLLASKNK